MDPQVLIGAVRSRRIRSVLIALGLIAVATIVFAAAIYLEKRFQGLIPASNWAVAMVCGLVTLFLLGQLGFSRAYLKEASLIAATGITCATVSILWGPRWIFYGVLAAAIVEKLVAWHRRRQASPNKSLERTREK
jgi:xanthine/uracil permease